MLCFVVSVMRGIDGGAGVSDNRRWIQVCFKLTCYNIIHKTGNNHQNGIKFYKLIKFVAVRVR